MNSMSSVVQVFDTDDKKLYEGDSRDRATEYAYRLLMLGTHDFLNIRETSSKGARRSVLTREQAHRWYNRKQTFDGVGRKCVTASAGKPSATTIQQKIRAKRYANFVTATFFLAILIATLQAMLSIL